MSEITNKDASNYQMSAHDHFEMRSDKPVPEAPQVPSEAKEYEFRVVRDCKNEKTSNSAHYKHHSETSVHFRKS
ncbi:hypothetical protein L3Y34_005495 [Caenorhabditis briggsae]|uniref:Uncharacterized protein n=1 Tax=Caenorhabditis briggsae TaxID=6238 RepID=A0AAE9AJA9_CAEBR|nr:hypothetical protein L3Y34_005495 [Caenorhabditis briggsae]